MQLGATNPKKPTTILSPKEFAQQLKRQKREAEDREREKNIREKQMKEIAAMLSSSESETEEAPVTTFSPSPVPAARKPGSAQSGSGPPHPNADPCNIPPLPEIDNIEQPETIFVDLTADSNDENETVLSERNPDLIIISDSDEF